MDGSASIKEPLACCMLQVSALSVGSVFSQVQATVIRFRTEKVTITEPSRAGGGDRRDCALPARRTRDGRGETRKTFLIPFLSKVSFYGIASFHPVSIVRCRREMRGGSNGSRVGGRGGGVDR